jgi:hypothetical protein
MSKSTISTFRRVVSYYKNMEAVQMTMTTSAQTAETNTCGDSEIVVVTDAEEIIASDRATVDEYIRNWGPLDIYLRLRSEVE